MLNQIGMKPIIDVAVMDVAIMQCLCDMHELFQRGYPWRWLNQLTLKNLSIGHR
jgi:hypothetical protein